ncbi:MAG: hypothetical protein ABI654_14685 [Betaproteobacteria bacterium]
MRRLLVTTVVLSGVLTLPACMEVEQTTSPERQAGQTVRRDTAAWNNEPLANGPKWSKGDRTSWEEQIKRRQLTQHEDRRIYQ